MNGITGSFLSLDLFSLTFKNIFLALLRGGGDRPHPPMDPPLALYATKEIIPLRTICIRHMTSFGARECSLYIGVQR